MKKFLFLLLLTPILGAAQFDTTKFYRSPNYGDLFRRAKINQLIIPGDTTTNKVGIAQIGSKFFVYSSSRWNEIGSVNIDGKLNISDTAAMLVPYKHWLAGYIQPTRTIATTAPLNGGGDLSANRTLSIDSANAARDGYLSRHDWSVFNNKLNTTGGTLTGALTNSYNSIANTPASRLTGTWFTGGTSTTTKPHFLIEPTAATSTGWNANGTAFGVNAAPGFIGNLMDLHFNGTSQFRVALNAVVTSGQFTAGSSISATTSIISGGNYNLPNAYKLNWGGGNTFIEGRDTYIRFATTAATERARFDNSGNFIIGATSGTERLSVVGNLSLTTAGNKILIATGSNASVGTATLSSGTITVNTTAVTANSIILLTPQNCSNCGTVYISSRTANTSFAITSTNVLDGSIIAYQIIN